MPKLENLIGLKEEEEIEDQLEEKEEEMEE